VRVAVGTPSGLQPGREASPGLGRSITPFRTLWNGSAAVGRGQPDAAWIAVLDASDVLAQRFGSAAATARRAFRDHRQSEMTLCLPSEFMLLGAMNPHPCSYQLLPSMTSDRHRRRSQFTLRIDAGEDSLITLDIISAVVNKTGISKSKAETAVEAVLESCPP
jgi:hypothetical protein